MLDWHRKKKSRRSGKKRRLLRDWFPILKEEGFYNLQKEEENA